MDVLIDSHALIWFLDGNYQLSQYALSTIENLDNRKYISIASLWEISIKIGIGKLQFDGGTKEIFEMVEVNGFKILEMKSVHVKAYEVLELIHRDPFDRIIVVQAFTEGMHIVTKDENINKYDISTIW